MRDRSLGHTHFPYLFLDATCLEAHQGPHAVSRAVVIATGVRADGGREVLGPAVGDSKDGAFWTAFLGGLRSRGLGGVQPVSSDAHEGLEGAIGAVMSGAVEQMLLDAAPDITAFAAIPPEPVAPDLVDRPARAGSTARSGAGATSSGLFPDDAAIVRLVAAVLIDTHDGWQVIERRYLSEGSMAAIRASGSALTRTEERPALLAS